MSMSQKPHFRLAAPADLPAIMAILDDAKNLLKAQGSSQWQDGYPDQTCIEADLAAGSGHVITQDGQIIGYLAILLTGEPAYATLAGRWLSSGAVYGVVHRLAVSGAARGQKLGELALLFAEQFLRQKGIGSLRIDTDAANQAMRHLFGKLGYEYCGKIWIQRSEKLAYEKRL